MKTPPHIANLKRAADEAHDLYIQATDGDDPVLTRALGDAVEILDSIYHHEYNNPLNWVVAVNCLLPIEYSKAPNLSVFLDEDAS